jgi:hypothetical protein
MRPIPGRLAGTEVFTRVRTHFQNVGFDERTYEEIAAALAEHDAFPAFGDPIPPGVSPSELLFRLFTGSRIARADFPGPVDDLLTLGFIEIAPDNTVSATVRIRPMFDLYVLSDLETPETPDDYVFAPDDPDALRYLSFVPLEPCGRFLEACGGSGIAALAAARRGAGHAWSSDISERCTAFARLSAALSGIDNFTAVTGDTYQPLSGLSFDRIALHPPFMPVLHGSQIYHGGGQDGEQITRKHIEDLPGRLNPGGRLHCHCMATDREGEPFEQRLRRWLGAHAADFDIAIHVDGYIDRSKFILSTVRSGRTKPEEIPVWDEIFRESERPVFTVRRDEGPYSAAGELAWLIALETARAAQGPSLTLHSRLRANPVIALNIVQTCQTQAWAVRKITAEVLHPYPVKRDLDPVLARILPQLDGTQTGFELYRGLQSANALDPAIAPEAFAARLADLAAGGFLFVEGCEPPSPQLS